MMRVVRGLPVAVATLLSATGLSGGALPPSADVPAVSAARIPGPFMAEALSFYFVHSGGPLELTLQARASADCPATRQAGGAGSGTLENPKVLYRFFDPHEKLVAWSYERLAPGSVTEWAHDFGDEAPPGVYQVRYAGQGLTTDAWATPEKAFGLAPSRCQISVATKGQFETLWFFVPPGCRAFSVDATATWRIADRRDEPVAAFSALRPNERVDVGTRQGEVLRFGLDSNRAGAYYRFGFSGIDPVVLCPNPETAEAVAAHFKRRPDGTLFKHHFQARMQAWIDGLTADDLAIEPANLKDCEEHWLAHPDAAAGLLGILGAFSHLDFLLRDQDVDPGSPSFGRFKTAAAPETLALAYSLDRPYNPYCRHPAIKNRLLLHVFLDLLELQANDTWSASSSNYSGTDALDTAVRFKTLLLATDGLDDPAMRVLWVEGMRRVADRFPFFRVSAENQSSHWPLAYWSLYEATGHETFKRLAADYIAGMTRPEENRFMATGYQGEAYGPDATYQGLGAANQALYYRLSGDPNAKAGLQRIYRFFNHSVAPEPNGTVFGASGFAHRTRGSWTERQYGGGLVLMAGELPEAAGWIAAPLGPPTPDEIRRALSVPVSDARIKSSPQILGYATHVIGPYWQRFRFPTMPLPDAALPAVQSNDFWRNFNGEFLAVRRPGYYCFVYLHGTAGEWVKARRRTRADDLPHPNNKWNEVPGPQLFWTPEYGSFSASMNWTADTLHMVRADLADGSLSLPDYWKNQSEASEAGKSLTMRQSMVGLPLTVERRFSFGQGVLGQRIAITASGDVDVEALYEQIPLLANKPGFELRFRHQGQWRETPGLADAFRVRGEKGHGVLVAFDRPRVVALGERQVFGRQEILPLRIHFPTILKAGENINLDLSLRPLDDQAEGMSH